MELCRLKVLPLADRFLKMPEVQKTIISLENLKSSKRKFKENGWIEMYIDLFLAPWNVWNAEEVREERKFREIHCRGIVPFVATNERNSI